MTTSTVPTDLARLVEQAFDDRSGNPLATTLALLVLRDGETIVERYGRDTDETTTLISWSMAKSMTSALCGIVVERGLIELDAPAPVPEWRDADDPRSAITLRDLLEMRSGLEWTEDYVDDTVSDVIEMLFGAGRHDTAAFAAAKPLAHPPGTHFLYSSGTTNIVARILGDVLGGRTATERALREDLFAPAGMASAEPTFDDAGTFIGSSFVYATARDFARFGELYRRSGLVDGEPILSERWIAESVRLHSVDRESGQGYGLHWWLVRDEHGSYACNGYEGQRIQVVPDLGLTIVRLGKTDAAFAEDLRGFYADIVACFE